MFSSRVKTFILEWLENTGMTDLKEKLSELCDCEYPATIQDVMDKCDNLDVLLPDGEEINLGDVVDKIDNPPERFKSEDELYNFVMSLAPNGSVGRKEYDDRNGALLSDEDQVSL